MSWSLINRARLFDPLEALAQGHWDLTTALPEPRRGAWRVLAGLVNRLLANLQAIVLKMAAASVGLGRVAPELNDLARNLADGAQDQARRAEEIAEASRNLAAMVEEISQGTHQAAAFSQQVAETTQTLQDGSRDISEIMALIQRVANQTKLLSLNAAVEAARAGEHGLGFAVVASEIQRLADQTMAATGRVGEILGAISSNVGELAQAVGVGNGVAGSAGQGENLYGLISRIAAAGREQSERVQRVTEDIQSVASTARAHFQDSQALGRLGDVVRQASDALLVSVGVFRLAAHQKARQVIETLAGHAELLSFERGRQEGFLRQVAARYPFFELLYITDAQGRQVVNNIAAPGFQASYGSGGYGQNWSRRPWFTGAVQAQGVYISDIYRSVASDSFCFTISAPLVDQQGQVLGVLAADVHFEQMLAQ